MDHLAFSVELSGFSSPRGRPPSVPGVLLQDYRSTINKHYLRQTWMMANLEYSIDVVGGAQFISVADEQSAYWQISVHPDHVEFTAFVSKKSGKYCYNCMPFGGCNAPRGVLQKWLIKRSAIYLSCSFIWTISAFCP